MDKHFDAIKIVSGQDESTLALVWWDGKHIRSNKESFLSRLRKEEINGMRFSDGEDFLNVLPYRFSNGYMFCRKVIVDEKGQEV